MCRASYAASDASVPCWAVVSVSRVESIVALVLQNLIVRANDSQQSRSRGGRAAGALARGPSRAQNGNHARSRASHENESNVFPVGDVVRPRELFVADGVASHLHLRLSGQDSHAPCCSSVALTSFAIPGRAQAQTIRSGEDAKLGRSRGSRRAVPARRRPPVPGQGLHRANKVSARTDMRTAVLGKRAGVRLGWCRWHVSSRGAAQLV